MPDYTITELDISNRGLIKLQDDIDKYTNLEKLKCWKNQITSLYNLPRKLVILICSDNIITSLDNLPPTLIKLDCKYNKLTSLDNPPPKLEVLYCGGNPLKYDFVHTLENIRNYNASRILSS